MSNSINTEAESLRDAHSYSSTVRSILGFTAFAVTLLPIPIIYFRLLPAYQRHAWFLLFYTPFLCLITLCYLFYVRDSLARAISANVLNPPPPPDHRSLPVAASYPPSFPPAATMTTSSTTTGELEMPQYGTFAFSSFAALRDQIDAPVLASRTFTTPVAPIE